MNFDLLEFIRARYKIIVPIVLVVVLATGYLIYRNVTQVGVGQSSAAELQSCGALGGSVCCVAGSICPQSGSTFTCPSGYDLLGDSSDCHPCCKATASVPDSQKSCDEILDEHCGGGNFSDCGTALCLQGGTACPANYTGINSKECSPCCIPFPAESSYQVPAKLTTCNRLPESAALLPDGHNAQTIGCPRADQAVCPSIAAYPRCGKATGIQVYDTVADELRTGNLDWDRSTNLLFNQGPAPFNDHTKWQWFKVPTTLKDWCDSNSAARLIPASPPPNRPCSTGARCLDGSTGGLDYSKCTVVSGGGTGTPVPSGSVSQLVCAPVSQTISLGQRATVQASGGNGIFQWNFSGGGVLESGGTTSVEVSYPTTGQKTLTVNSGGLTARCTVNVVAATLSTSPTPAVTGGPVSGQPVLSITKSVQNTTLGTGEQSALSIALGQVAQFTVRVTNIGSGSTSALMVFDTLPAGMSYAFGSTRVEGQAVQVDTITAGGLSLGRLDPGDTVTIQWSAAADRPNQLAGTSQTSNPQATAQDVSAQNVSANVAVTVYQSGASLPTTSVGPGGVQTGPGDAVTIALVVAAVLTLLYAGYTRSMAYRQHEAEDVSRDQGPMDFRS